MQAFIGGFVAQEIIKAITNKFTPLKQLFYMDCIEVLPADYDNSVKESRKESLAVVLGTEIL